MTQDTTKRATLYRMVTAEHTCPYGLKARDLLKRKGYAVEDNLLRTRAEIDAFKAAHDVKSTPQTFIEGTRIGGYDDLRRFLGLAVTDPNAVTYSPVIAVFVVAAALAIAGRWAMGGSLVALQTVEWFIAISMSILALLKLQDLESFSRAFLGYDLLAQKYVPYSYIYPFAELGAGVLMLAGVLSWLSIPVAVFIGTVGAVSVVKAVYVDKRTLKCACVGGGGRVPLGFVSLTENVMMVAMGLWMALAMF